MEYTFEEVIGQTLKTIEEGAGDEPLSEYSLGVKKGLKYALEVYRECNKVMKLHQKVYRECNKVMKLHQKVYKVLN